MANRSRPTLLKRERERARIDKQKQKNIRRLAAKARRDAAPPRSGDEDPDIAHIQPGPQPIEWLEEEDEPSA